MARVTTKRWVAAAWLGLAAGALLVGGASPAGADVVTPPGACAGAGKWVKGGFTEISTRHQPSDVIDIPRADTVEWAGTIRGARLGGTGPRRDIEGKVEVELPFGTVTIDSWDKSSARYANVGAHKYDLPSVLTGIKIKVKGFHKDNGNLTCSGSIYLKVKGSTLSNPLAIGSIGGLVIFGGLLLYAGRPVVRKISAYEDINPG